MFEKVVKFVILILGGNMKCKNCSNPNKESCRKQLEREAELIAAEEREAKFYADGMDAYQEEQFKFENERYDDYNSNDE